MKVIKAEKAILFDCPECGHSQYHEYDLCDDWYEDRAVNSTIVECEECEKEVKVIEEL